MTEDITPRASTAVRSDYSYYITALLFLLTTWLFLRSVLPRIPRLFLRGRLRVRRVGLRGVRGVEWRANGYSASKTNSAQSPTADQGLAIKVEHAYLKVNFGSKASRTASEQPSSNDGAAEARKGWLTIHVQGVGVRLSRSPGENDQEARKMVEEKARRQAEEEQRIAREAQEAADRRLEDLVNGTASTSYGGFRRPSLMSREPSDQGSPYPPPDVQPQPQQSAEQDVSKVMSLAQLIQCRVIPWLRTKALQAIRAVLFVITSSLPALTSLVDVEVSRLEVYVQDAESVVRVERAGLELSMALVSGRHTGLKKDAGKTKQRNASQTWRSMPNRLGCSARDAASFVTAGLPAGRAGLLFDLQGVQVFEADIRARCVGKHEPGVGTSSSQQWLRGRCPPKAGQIANTNANADTAAAPTSSVASSSRRLANRCIDWAEWGLEPSPTSGFSADTGWLTGRPVSESIPASACLLSIENVSKLEVGLLLGPSLRLGGKEALELHLTLGDINIGLDALYRVVRVVEERKALRSGPAPTVEGASGDRSGLSKHVAQQRKGPAAKALDGLRALSLELPVISVRSHSTMTDWDFAQRLDKEERQRLPDSIEFETVLRDFRLSLSTSNPADDIHRRWIGACGIKKQRSGADASSASNSGGKVGEVVEHRRVFQLDGGMGSFDVSCAIDGQQTPSRLLHLGQLKGHARSAWTPFGLFPLADDSNTQGRQYFSSDPNEQVLYAELSLAQVRGDLKFDCASAMMSFVQMRAAERRALRKSLDIDQPPRQNRLQLLDHVPKLALGFEISDVSYRIDVKHGTSLIYRLPRLSLNGHGSYRDAFIKRSDAERRAAWKAFHNDELEWSLTDDLLAPASTSPFASPRIPGASSFSTFVDRWKGQLSPGGRRSRSPELMDRAAWLQQRSSSPMSMESALRLQGQASPRSVSPGPIRSKRGDDDDEGDGDDDDIVPLLQASRPTRSVRVPTRLIRRASSASKADCAMWYDLEANVSCPSMESFFVFADSNNEHDEKLTRRQLLAINNIELGVEGTVPGTQDPTSSHVALKITEHQSKIRGLLEEIDVELWHPRVLDALEQSMRQLEAAAQPLQSEDADDDVEPASTSAPSRVPLIDRLPGSFELWLSIGGVLAHVGGSDPNCDPFLSRGVGLEARRIVAEVVSASGKADYLLRSRSDWGARSALTLAEDVKVSAQALAARHKRAAVAKTSLFEVGLFPLLDVQQATHVDSRDLRRAHRREADESDRDNPADALFADAVWNFQRQQPVFQTSARKRYHQEDHGQNFICSLPYLALKASVFPPGAETATTSTTRPPAEVVFESDGINLLTLRIQLLHSYCCLVALAALRRLRTKQKQSAKSKEKRSPQEGSQRPSALAKLAVSDIHVFIDLPEDVKLFLHIRRLDCRLSDQDGLSVRWESLMGAVESPRMLTNDLWEEAIRLRDWEITIPKKRKADDKPHINVVGDAASLRVPFGYVVHNIIDSASVAFKATKQLVYQFAQGGEGSIITPVPEDPKHIPHVNLRVRILTLEAQDDPIETRLNIIWRAGRDENRARMERAEAFEERVAGLAKGREDGINASQTSLFSTSSKGSSTSLSDDDDDDDEDDDDRDESDVDDHRSMRSDRSSSRRKTSAKIDVDLWCDKARQELAAYDSASWIRRYANARAEQSRKEDAILRRIFGRNSAYRHPVELPVQMAQPTRAAPLFRSTMSDLDITVGPPSFPESELQNWLHAEGNGTPKDLPYSLLVPLHIDWKMGEWKWELRDYPLPLLHFPPKHGGSGKSSPSSHGFQLKADLCIAEHLSEGNQSIRHVPAVVVPAACGHPDSQEYGINVPKVAMPVKIYGSPVIELSSKWPTRFCWGQSIQPVIADMVRVFDGISSPPHDPSPKLGFWDKLPLIFHTKWLFRWKGTSELHFHLKGSRDPYYINGNGAGWVKCWRGDVEIRLGWDNEDGEFFQVISDEYFLAIPDLRGYQDRAATGSQDPVESDDEDALADSKADRSAGTRNQSLMSESHFTKVCLRLANGVRWGASLIHEHTCRDGRCERKPPCKGENFYRECRFFDRIPHWEVIQRSREYMAQLPEEDQTDSFYGWRSDSPHLGISIYSPKNGLKAYGKHRRQPEGSNNLYFSPLAWQHFWAWMRLFNSAMALPIRQGQLFPNAPPPSPKFGRHLGTIKYRFDIAPLFISHLYTQFSRSDWARGVSTMLGIKARLDVFHIDMHQRQQEMVKERAELQKAQKVFHKPFYEAEADFSGIDLRTLVGRFQDSSKRLIEFDDVDADPDENVNFLGGENPEGPDSSWVDLDDFVEVDYTPSVTETPEIRLIQALTCPHFNFYRRLDSHGERENKNKNRPKAERKEEAVDLEYTKFGNERAAHTHTCLIGQGPKPAAVQEELAAARLEELHQQLTQIREGSSDRLDKESTDELVQDIRRRIQLVEQHRDLIDSKYSGAADNFAPEHKGEEDHAGRGKQQSSKTHIDGAANINELLSDWDTFEDRFLIHNPTFFFSNQTRLILLRYYSSSKRRKSIIHHLTARAIWNIRQLNKRSADKSSRPTASRKPTHVSEVGSELLTDLLSDTMQHVMADMDTALQSGDADAFLDTHIDPTEGIASDLKVKRSNICAFIKPQFVLSSQIDDASSVVITAVRMRLRNFAVMDPSVSDEDALNGRVLSRNYFTLDGLQAFHPTPRTVMYSHRARHAGCAISVPLETLIDVRQETQDFARIVSRTDASIRYDKFNRLRLHDSSRPVYGDTDRSDASTDHLRHYMDLLRVRCPRFAVSANSAHFGALYNIVTDLILYRDPAWREHAKQLETTLLSHDFKNVDALADAVADLQLRIRGILECDEEYQFHFDELNERGRQDFFYLKAEMADVAQELLLLAEAITASEDAKGDDDKDKKSALRMEAHAQDLSWNMMGEHDGELLAKLSIKRPSFTWLNKADNSAANSLSIVDLNAVDVRPEAHFAEIISKWKKAPDHPMAKQGRFVNAVWSELAPVGGISIVDQFELDLHPLKLQLEMRVGKMIMDYIFGSKRHREEEERKRKEVLDAHASNGQHKHKPSAFLRLTHANKSGDASAGGSEASSRRTSTSSEGRPSKSSRSVATEGSGRSKPEQSRPASIRGGHGSDEEDEGEDYSQLAIAQRNAAQMRKRSSSNLTFVYFKLPETVFCMSYKGDKDKSITDVYDLVFRAPNIEYRNRTWAYEDLVQHMKRDIFRAAWGQKTTILKSILSHRPRRPEALRNIREKQALLRKTSRENRGLSPLQLHVHPPSPPGGVRSFGDGSEQAQSPSLMELGDDEEKDENRGARRHRTTSGPTTPVREEGEGRLLHAASSDQLGPTESRGSSNSAHAPSNGGSSRLGRFLQGNGLGSSGNTAQGVSSGGGGSGGDGAAVRKVRSASANERGQAEDSNGTEGDGTAGTAGSKSPSLGGGKYLMESIKARATRSRSPQPYEGAAAESRE